MNKNHDLLTVLNKHEINEFGVISFKEEFVLYKHKLKGLGFYPKSIIVCLFPYYFGDKPKTSNLSRYAMIKDYHLVIDDILRNICDDLEVIYKGNYFKSFVDDSPFCEKQMACYGGLCIKGRHDICLNQKYGSYFFIGEIATDVEFEEKFGNDNISCCEAMPCVLVCPTGAIYLDQNKSVKFIKERCLSYISQKKSLSYEEKSLLSKSKSAWGCDLCQEACTKNKGINKTHIEEFLEVTPYIKINEISNFSDEEFKRIYVDKVFSWKGKKVIERNLKILDDEIDNT